jgi:hypothetical protein
MTVTISIFRCARVGRGREPASLPLQPSNTGAFVCTTTSTNHYSQTSSSGFQPNSSHTKKRNSTVGLEPQEPITIKENGTHPDRNNGGPMLGLVTLLEQESYLSLTGVQTANQKFHQKNFTDTIAITQNRWILFGCAGLATEHTTQGNLVHNNPLSPLPLLSPFPQSGALASQRGGGLSTP